MPDGIEVASDIGPVAELIAALHSEGEPGDRPVRLRRQAARCRAAAEQYADQLNQLYQEVECSGHGADWLVQAADVVRQKEETAREKLRPGIEKLKQKLAAWHRPHDAAARQLIEESIAIGEAWLSFPATLHKKLLLLAADRRAAAEKIRHARPVEGEIDHAELTREIISRFPKILSELAK